MNVTQTIMAAIKGTAYMGGEGSKTPDGGVYNFKCVREALASLE